MALRRSPLAETGFFYALVDVGDRYHRVSRELLDKALAQKRRLVTTNFVVAETHALLLSRLGRDMAAEWLESVEQFALVERDTEEDESEARAIIRRYVDKDFSYTDATCFAVMARLGITMCLSTDAHFVQYGRFLVLPLSATSFPRDR